MTDEQINIKIAELMGYDFDPEQTRDWWSHGRWVEAPDGEMVFKHGIPNYATDLNACHEFEEGLDYDQAALYDEELCDICAETNELLDNPKPWRFAVTIANARQRCEAFLRVHGQWEEEV